MRKKRQLKTKYLLIYFVATVLIMIILPLVSIKIFPPLVRHELTKPYTDTIPRKVKLYIVSEDKYRKIDFEKYVEGVVAAEMPSSFHMEALKAQAIASRTFALGRIKAGSQLCDTVHCQAYRNKDISARVKKAVQETKGEVLIYDGSLAGSALYFSSSAGPTEDSCDVFTGTTPYLKSVPSGNEPEATHKKEIFSMSLRDFSSKIKDTFPELSFGKITKQNIKILSHSKGGRVLKVKVGKESLSGTDIRRALSLYSTRMKISFKGSKIIITTAGSGHGVGMSQYGANGLAKEGLDYTQILSHYYSGVSIGK